MHCLGKGEVVIQSKPANLRRHKRAVPYWVCNQTGYYCSQNIDYHISWLNCTRQYNIGPIDYIGNWNEKPVRKNLYPS